MSVGTATPPGRRGASADANIAEDETNEERRRETSAESPTRRRLLEELSPSSTSPAEPDNKRREIGAISTKKDTSWIKRNPDGSDDKHIIASMYDVAPNIAQGERHDLRMQELLKLESFGSWKVVNLNDYDKRMVFGTRWVDTMSKSRITVQDLKKFGEATGLTNCPTPSASTNALLEALCTIRGHSMAGFDIVSAFPHADESSEWIVVRPPQEFVDEFWRRRKAGEYSDFPDQGVPGWYMLKALYGRRTAGADFRDYLEKVQTGLGFTRGISDPCVYYHKDRNLVVTHHIDDGRVIGESPNISWFFTELCRYFILK